MVVTTVTTGDYPYSFEDLARELRTPGTTLRRYFKVFHTFIPNKLVKRGTRFNDDAKQLFEDINKMYAQRMSTDEITGTLAATRMPTIDVRPSSPAQAPAPQQMDLESLAPALAALLPLAERYLAVYERQTKALEDIAARLPALGAIGGHQNAREGQGRVKGHPEGETGQDEPKWQPVDKEALVVEVMRLRAMGYGAARIRTTMVKAGWGSLAGPGKRLSKSTVAKIIKSNGGDIQ